jgi:hypothetical protein
MKKLIVLFIVLLAIPSFADDFADSLLKQTAIVKQNLGFKTNAPAYPDSIAEKHIRMATIDVNVALWANKVQDTVYTVENQDAYVVDSVIRPFEVYFINADTLIALKRVHVKNFIGLYNTPEELTGEEEYGRFPAFYDWFNNRLVLYPVPVADDDTLIIEGLGKIVNIFTDTTIGDTIIIGTDTSVVAYNSTTFPSQLDIHYRMAVLYRATYLGALAKDMPQWKAQSWKSLYDETVNTIRTVIDDRTYMETPKSE